MYGENMTTKIYIRERNSVSEHQKEPRFRIVAITGDRSSIKIDASHFRLQELQTITADVGAELVVLEPMEGCCHHHHEGHKKCCDKKD